jgi:hypothetical protein
VIGEAGDVDDPAEQLAEQEQPDHRLDDAERQHPWLPDQGVQLPARQVPGVRHGGTERHGIGLRRLESRASGRGRIERYGRHHVLTPAR